MHSLGVLHCDIRPRNVLIDEYGILKISDFKLARKVPISPLGDLPLNQRGYLPYMAPELFSPDGTHSYGSDLWNLGCVLFELRRGALPFGEFTAAPSGASVPPTTLDPNQGLIEKINTIDPFASLGSEAGVGTTTPPGHPSPQTPSPSTGNFSPELADLLHWLLEKFAGHRCDWSVRSLFHSVSLYRFTLRIPFLIVMERQRRCPTTHCSLHPHPRLFTLPVILRI